MTESHKSFTLACVTCGQLNRVAAPRLTDAPRCGACGEGLVSSKVMTLDAAGHAKVTRSDSLPVLIDYWAPWCGPCKMMAPEFAKAAAALSPNLRLMKLNTQDFPAVSQRLGIQGIPLLILHQNGREIARLPGMRPAKDIIDFARKYVKAPK